jgi:Rieske Fe-S protein
VPQSRPLPRRTVLSGAALAGTVLAAGPALVSCRSSAGSTGQPGSTTTVKKSDVPVGGGVIDAATGVVVVQPTAGVFKAFSAICPHQGCQVAGIAGGVISCPCHGATFKIADGSVIAGPAPQGLTALTVKVSSSEVLVSF